MGSEPGNAGAYGSSLADLPGGTGARGGSERFSRLLGLSGLKGFMVLSLGGLGFRDCKHRLLGLVALRALWC